MTREDKPLSAKSRAETAGIYIEVLPEHNRFSHRELNEYRIAQNFVKVDCS